MAFISTVQEAEARGAVAEMYAASKKNMGYLPNYTQIFSHRDDSLRQALVVGRPITQP